MSKHKKPKPKWFAGKRYKDGSIEIVNGFWKEAQYLFNFDNHSVYKGFKTREEAEAWVYGLGELPTRPPVYAELDQEFKRALELDP